MVTLKSSKGQVKGIWTLISRIPWSNDLDRGWASGLTVYFAHSMMLAHLLVTFCRCLNPQPPSPGTVTRRHSTLHWLWPPLSARLGQSFRHAFGPGEHIGCCDSYSSALLDSLTHWGFHFQILAIVIEQLVKQVPQRRCCVVDCVGSETEPVSRWMFLTLLMIGEDGNIGVCKFTWILKWFCLPKRDLPLNLGFRQIQQGFRIYKFIGRTSFLLLHLG